MYGLAALHFKPREQIEIRVHGFGWSDFACPISAIKKETTAQLETRLHAQLKDILLEEVARKRLGQIPTEPPMPELAWNTAKQLGTPTTDATALMAETFCSPETLARAVEFERERREAAGFTDSVQAKQPPQEPPLDNSLIGKRLEICWAKYKDADGNNVAMWCPCKVTRVADGEMDKGTDGKPLSSAARKLAPRGMVLVEWDADPDREEPVTYVWYLLDPSKWNGKGFDGHRAWRWHPEELAKMLQPARTNKRAH